MFLSKQKFGSEKANEVVGQMILQINYPYICTSC